MLIFLISDCGDIGTLLAQISGDAVACLGVEVVGIRRW